MLMIKSIDTKVLDDFVIQHPYGHYMKTSMWAKVKALEGFKIHYCRRGRQY